MAKRKKIGLLGGSFNPAHEGHIQLSEYAYDTLDLDEVWWLVTPGNPLKDNSELPSLKERMKQASELVEEKPFIQTSDIEQELKTHYTVDTLEGMVQRFPEYQFVWLMGADGLANFHKWKEWKKIAGLVPFAVFNREPYSDDALESEAAIALKESKQTIKVFAKNPKGWCFVDMPNNPISSTKIRNARASEKL